MEKGVAKHLAVLSAAGLGLAPWFAEHGLTTLTRAQAIVLGDPDLVDRCGPISEVGRVLEIVRAGVEVLVELADHADHTGANPGSLQVAAEPLDAHVLAVEHHAAGAV